MAKPKRSTGSMPATGPRRSWIDFARVAVGVLGALGVLALFGEMARNEGRLEGILDEKNRQLEEEVSKRRDPAQDLEQARRDVTKAPDLNDLLARYGTDFELYRRSEAGNTKETLPLGDCDKGPCFVAEPLRVIPKDDKGHWMSFQAPGTPCDFRRFGFRVVQTGANATGGKIVGPMNIAPSLKTGCSVKLKAQRSLILFRVEDARFERVALGEVVVPLEQSGIDRGAIAVQAGGCESPL